MQFKTMLLDQLELLGFNLYKNPYDDHDSMAVDFVK